MDSTVQTYWNNLPYVLLVAFALVIAAGIPDNDLTRNFIPVGGMLLRGENPYVINTQAPFLYWPPGLWVFAALALLPAVHHLLLAVNAAALVAVVRRMELSPWWCLYPPALYTLNAGQLDILVLWLSVEAYWRRAKIGSALPMAAALAVKPQVALFLFLPWLWGMPDTRRRVKAAGLVAGVLIIPTAIWMLLMPDTGRMLWQGWLDGVRQNSGIYISDSPSLWAAGLPTLAVATLIGWLILSGSLQVSRPLLALGLPAMRYYSSIGLLGAVPVWGVGLGYLSALLTLVIGKPVFWIEPLAMLAYHTWMLLRARTVPGPTAVVQAEHY